MNSQDRNNHAQVTSTITIGETVRISDHYLNAPADFTATLTSVDDRFTHFTDADGDLISISTHDLAVAIEYGEVTIR